MKTRVTKEQRIKLAQSELTLRLYTAIHEFEPNDPKCPKLSNLEIIQVLAGMIHSQSK